MQLPPRKVNLSIAYRKPIWYLMGVAIQTLRELFGSCIKSGDLTREYQGRGVLQLPHKKGIDHEAHCFCVCGTGIISGLC